MAPETRQIIHAADMGEPVIRSEGDGFVLIQKIGGQDFELPVKTVFQGDDPEDSIHIGYLDCTKDQKLRLGATTAVAETICGDEVLPHTIFVGLPTIKSQGFSRGVFGEVAVKTNIQGLDFLELDGGKTEECDLEETLMATLKKEQEEMGDNIVGQVWRGRNQQGETIDVVQYLPITGKGFKALIMTEENAGRFRRAMRNGGMIKIIDDVMSRGGTIEAALKLMEKTLGSAGFSRETTDLHVIAVEGGSMPQLGVRLVTAETRLPILRGDLSLQTVDNV